MLTKLTVRNFKRFEHVEVELGSPVVFVGPNNSGKTTALQALALWDIGVKRWMEKRGGRNAPERRPGVTINRRDLLAVPVPDASLLWRALHVRDVSRESGKQTTKNVRIDIVVDGVSDGLSWSCGLEFDYANDESIYCRPLRTSEADASERFPVPPQAGSVRIAFLPPMSGLTANETRLDPGAVNVRLGEGRTAEVLRNLCYRVASDGEGGRDSWNRIVERIARFFSVTLDDPVYVPERGEISMTYRDGGTRLDLSSSGRGLQQTLLLLAHLEVNPGSVLLLDEPDAHLEVLRQRQIYQTLVSVAGQQGSQIVAASHSEIILNEAAGRDMVIAFVGRPHRIDDRGSQVAKALKEIGHDQFYQAEHRGWVLYLEGSTDLAILQAFARTLGHTAEAVLDDPFVQFVGNQPSKARDHFFGLQEAKTNLVGFALFDRLESILHTNPNLKESMWTHREIENYLCSRAVLVRWADAAGRDLAAGPLFAANWPRTMDESIDEVESAMATLRKGSPWSADTKVTDDFLDPLFEKFFEKLGLPNLMRKTEYYVLARLLTREEIHPDVMGVLDAVAALAKRARPAGTAD